MLPHYIGIAYEALDTCERFFGYRYSTTGFFSYEFYCGNAKVCSASSFVIPSPPIGIRGCGKTWQSPFDEDSTIISGQRRYVYDEITKERVGVLTYMGRGSFMINGSVSVLCDDDGYYFFSDYRMIAQILRYRGEEIEPPDSIMRYSSDYELYYEGYYVKDISDALKLLVLSFPMLRFAP